MDFAPSERGVMWRERLSDFIDRHVVPAEAEYRAQVHADPRVQAPVMEALKVRAKEAGLWNMFLPGDHGAGLSNLEYAP